MTAPETEALTSRGEKLDDLRKAARIFGGFEPPEIIEAEKTAGQPPEGESDAD